VITLDEATLQFQPIWPGQPDAALWDFPDIVALDNADDIDRAALQVLYALRRRLELLISLPLHGADPSAIRSDVRDLAHMQ
jgi:arsenate reductase